jgi:hypothetical protein
VHVSKTVRPGPPVPGESTFLKWYELHAEEPAIPEDIRVLAKSALAEMRDYSEGFGFVILHRCGADFYFLIVSTWRSDNELWETVWFKDGDAMSTFAPFPRDKMHKPTYCVWELVPIWHEQQAWVRFLRSGRESRDIESWVNDTYAGIA